MEKYIKELNEIIFKFSNQEEQLKLSENLEALALDIKKNLDASEIHTPQIQSFGDISSQILEKYKSKKGMELLETLMDEFDKDVKLRRGEMVLLGACSGMGKTLLSSQLALNMAQVNHKVLYFTLDLNSNGLTERLLSNYLALPTDAIRVFPNQKPPENQLEMAMQGIKKLPLQICDNILNVTQLVDLCKELEDLDVVFIDCIQLLKGKNLSYKNSSVDYNYISYQLKRMAKELNICVIVCAKIDDEDDYGWERKQPQLDYLDNFGDLKQDADKIILLYRPEFNGIVEDKNHNSLRNVTELIIAKNKTGPIKKIYFKINEAENKLIGLKNTVIKEITYPNEMDDLPF